MTSGVYRIRHKRSGAAYVGGSADIGKRWSWHLTMLRRGKHTSHKLQELWSRDGEKAFVLEILVKVSGKRLRIVEDEIARKEKKLLNSRTNFGFKHSEEAKQRMRLGRAKYLEDPTARELLSERAKKQHAAGKLGRATWKEGTVVKYNSRSAVAGAKALKAHIANQPPEEMARRAKLRKRIYNRWAGEYIVVGDAQ